MNFRTTCIVLAVILAALAAFGINEKWGAALLPASIAFLALSFIKIEKTP